MDLIDKYLIESSAEAEDGIVNALSKRGEMSKDEIWKLIKRDIGLKRYEFNDAWKTLMSDGDIESAGNKKFRMA